ncbi:putative F-box protein [Capsicum annuum]|uniref:putative F-box protein At1g47790 n=1 Tax=Capsicum annuum TaxID=4072 RepID=UPI0007BEF19B|nr:putative F-box protein At1g47790 [Capsicum annuum]
MTTCFTTSQNHLSQGATMSSIWEKIIMKFFGEEYCRTNNSFLPEEIIDKILSRLPVKSLLRFKCVCKYWNSITIDPRFISLHYKLSQPRFIFKNPEGGRRPEFFVVTSVAGLLLERSYYDGRIRIRNPEMHKLLHLPDPSRESIFLFIDFTVLFSSEDYDNPVFKLVYVHIDGDELGYQVLDLGNYNEARCSYSWRTIKVPTNMSDISSTGEMREIQFLIRRGIGYCIWETGAPEDADIKIDILDVKNERYIGRTTCPHRGFFSFLNSADYILWGDQEKLAFARVVKDDHAFHILVLEDYKKQRWADRIFVIKFSPELLKITTDLLLRRENIHLKWASQFELVFHWQRGHPVCSYDAGPGWKRGHLLYIYDVNTGEVTTELYCPAPGTTNIKPSLFTLKGMSTQS